MKKSILLFSFAFTILALVFIAGCKKDSEATSAAFSFSGDGKYAPDTVKFTNSSTGAISYTWDFGDNTKSFDLNPTHVYAHGGTYNIKLTANGAGGTSTVTKTVTILKTPTSVKITYIKALAWPQLDPIGLPWDTTSGPDVYFEILGNTGNILEDYSDSTITDATVPANRVLDIPHRFANPNTVFKVDILDNDGTGTDENIGEASFFIPWDQTPQKLVSTDTATGVTIEVGLAWE